MKGFRFRLQPVLTLRRHSEESLQRCLANSQRVLEEEEARLEDLRVEVESQSRQAAERHQPGPLDVDRLSQESSYLEVLECRIEGQSCRVSEQVGRVASDLEAVLRASRDRKALEKVREDLLLAFAREEAHKDQKVSEEMATLRHLLRRQPEA